MDEQDQARQALMEMMRHDRAEAEAHPPRKPRGRLGPRGRAALLAAAVVIFVLAPTAFLVLYPRFGPVDTMTAFCTAETDGDYNTAYQLLSTRARQRVSLDAFTKASQATNMMTCSVSNGIPIIFGGTRATLDVTFDLVGNSNGIDGTMTFAREHGQWRVDSSSPDFFDLSS